MSLKLINLKFYENWDYFEILSNLFLLLLVSINMNYGEFEIGQFLCAVLGLFFFKLRESCWFWLCMFLIQLYYLISSWSSIDDHKFLMAAMSLSFFVALKSNVNSRLILEKNFSYLTGLVMFFTVFYKLYSYPEYGSGYFLSYIEILDKRFHWLVRLFGENPISLEKELLKQLAAYTVVTKDTFLVELNLSNRFVMINKFLEYSVLVIEMMIAGIFFLSKNSKLKVISLILFIFVVYSVVPVLGFALSFGVVGLSISLGKLERIYTKAILLVMFYAFLNLITSHYKMLIISMLLAL